MDLSTIKNYCRKRQGGLKKLAADIGMSEPNLHRCIRVNEIQASDLENIAKILGLDVRIFFDQLPQQFPSTAVNVSSTINGPQTVSNTIQESHQNTGSEEDHLKALLAERNRVLEEKERLIQVLLKQLEQQ